MLLENSTDPIIWKGPMISAMVEQFFTDVLWEELDYLLIDMPPGTSDVALTVLQKIDVDGLILVSSPQGLVNVIVEKAVKMANTLEVPIIGMVTNMAYVECPDCKKRIDIFGKANNKELLDNYDIWSGADVPFSRDICEAVEKGRIEYLNVDYLDNVRDELLRMMDEE